MDNDDIFEQLEPDERADVMKLMVVRMFGRDRAETMWRDMAPLVQDMMGHGRAYFRAVGEQPDGEDYWRGVWTIHEAE